MKRRFLVRLGAVLLALLMLWWLFWVVLADEDETEQERPETELMNAVE